MVNVLRSDLREKKIQSTQRLYHDRVKTKGKHGLRIKSKDAQRSLLEKISNKKPKEDKGAGGRQRR